MILRYQLHHTGASSSNRGPVVMPEMELKQVAVIDVHQQVAGVEAVYNALMSQVCVHCQQLEWWLLLKCGLHALQR